MKCKRIAVKMACSLQNCLKSDIAGNAKNQHKS